MRPYWVTFTDGAAGTCDGETAAAAAQTAADVTCKVVDGTPQPLPYAAQPVIWRHHDAERGITPPYCLHPTACVGKTDCPRSFGCDN